VSARPTRSDAERERRWGRIQAISGLLFGIFAALHLVNQMLAPAGPETYDTVQRAIRPFYQNPLIELGVVILPLGVHVVAGFRRLWLRGFRGRGGGWRMRLHRITGAYLLLVIFGHVVATRGPSLILDIYPEFAGVAFSLMWMPWIFYGYYAMLSFSGIYHGANGLLLATRSLGWRKGPATPGRLGFWLPVGSATALLWLAILAFGGQLFPIPDPSESQAALLVQELTGTTPPTRAHPQP
jgi:succinate dehydrogenase/fumarate reductase cytochrome b subunit